MRGRGPAGRRWRLRRSARGSETDGAQQAGSGNLDTFCVARGPEGIRRYVVSRVRSGPCSDQRGHPHPVSLRQRLAPAPAADYSAGCDLDDPWRLGLWIADRGRTGV